MSQFLPLNLTCRAGHRWYAPAREWFEWIGRDCLAGAHMRADGQPTRGRCLLPLAPLDVKAVSGAVADDVHRLDAQQVMVVAEPDGRDLDVVRHR